MTKQNGRTPQHRQLSITGFSDLHLHEAVDEAKENIVSKFAKSASKVAEYAVKIMLEVLYRSPLAVAAILLVKGFFSVLRRLNHWILAVVCWCLDRRPTETRDRQDPVDHSYKAPQKGIDARSPCPALNMLANHGYLERHGLNITHSKMIDALQQGFGLSFPLAWFLTHGGYLLTGQFRMVSLQDLRRHNGIEHNASLVHSDTPDDQEYASETFNEQLWEDLAKYAESDTQDGSFKFFTADSFAQLRVKREGSSSSIHKVHQEIARGEISLFLDILGRGERIGVEELHAMWAEERFPDGWAPGRVQTMARTILGSQGIKQRMMCLRAKIPFKRTWLMRFLQAYIDLFEVQGDHPWLMRFRQAYIDLFEVQGDLPCGDLAACCSHDHCAPVPSLRTDECLGEGQQVDVTDSSRSNVRMRPSRHVA